MGKQILDKHIKYHKYYKPNTTYWGLGIENEFYLQFENPILFTNEQFLKNHKEERYSVNYFSNYQNHILNQIFPKINYNGELPILINSHSFSKTDKNNQPKTINQKNSPTNPNFSGETLWEFTSNNNPILKTLYNNQLIFDGDTFEILTLNFFNTQLEQTFNEFILTRNIFIENIQHTLKKNNILQEFGKIKLMSQNHPYAVMLTNINNVSMFNNGTLHFNITLPTELNENAKIKDWNKFKNQHQNYIKLIQFMEPILIATYGQPDPLSEYDPRFSAASQRCAVSRYIGIGTYNTDLMKSGKILTSNINEFDIASQDYGWYKRYYEYCAYNKLDKIGYDINFNKHYNHGVEIRFFEHQTNDEKINEIFTYLIYLADFSLDNIILDNPIKIKDWNDIVLNTMKYGKNTSLNTKIYNNIFQHKFISTNIFNLSKEILNFLKRKYINSGQLSSLTIKNKELDILTPEKIIEENTDLIINELRAINLTFKKDFEEQRKNLEQKLHYLQNPSKITTNNLTISADIICPSKTQIAINKPSNPFPPNTFIRNIKSPNSITTTTILQTPITENPITENPITENPIIPITQTQINHPEIILNNSSIQISQSIEKASIQISQSIEKSSSEIISEMNKKKCKCCNIM